jgi:hypothetical protein
MAQRTIHYLFGDLISQQTAITDKERFLLGSVLPDATAGERDRAHFKMKTDNLSWLDLEQYRNRFLARMRQDDLYLGYYMHLVEDAFYRQFFYRNRFSRPGCPEEVRLLHRDYHILNSYVVQKYGIQNILTGEYDLAKEPLSEIALFRTSDFLKEMAGDFTETTQGTTVFLTEAMLDVFVESYLPQAVEEVKRVKAGEPLLQSLDYAWGKFNK